MCITLQNNRMGATLRVDLPSRPEHAEIYARKVASHLGSNADATASVFAIFADAPWAVEQRDFFPPLIHELAQQSSEFGMPIRAGWIVGPSPFAEYQPHRGLKSRSRQSNQAASTPNQFFAAARSRTVPSLAFPGRAPWAFIDDVGRRQPPTAATAPSFPVITPRLQKAVDAAI